MEPASLQDNSATLSVASIVLASQEFDGKLEQMDHDTYMDNALELGLPEIVYSVSDYNLLQRQLKQDMYEPQVLEENWNEFFQDDITLESIQEKTGNTFEFSDKQQPGNIGSRFGVPEFEFPVECRSCGERPRIEGSFYCPQCHPDRNAEDVDDSELVTEKYDYDYHSDKVESYDSDNPSRHEMNKEFSLDVYRVLSPDGELQDGFDGNMLGFAVDFPNSDVYVEWNNDIFPDPLDDGHVSIYSSLEDVRTATDNDIEFVRSVSEPDSIDKQSVTGHPEIPVENTAPEAVEFLERMEREGYDPSEEDEALLYELLGTGTPEWKMSKEDADYKQEPVGNEICANCQYYYVGTDGEGVCSKVRGQVYPEHWCRLWDAGDVLQGKSDKARVYVDSPEEVPDRYEVQTGSQGGTYYETDENSDVEEFEPVEPTENNPQKGGYFARSEKDFSSDIAVAAEEVKREARSLISDWRKENNIDRINDPNSSAGVDWSDKRGENSIYSPNTAPLWALGEKMSGREAPEEAPVNSADEDDVELMEEYQKVTEEWFRENFGEQVTLYRGLGGDIAEQMKESARGGEKIDYDPRAVESWTMSPSYASFHTTTQSENSVVIEAEISPEDIAMSSFTNPAMNQDEQEVVVSADELEITPEDVIA